MVAHPLDQHTLRRIFLAPERLVIGEIPVEGPGHHYLSRVLRLDRGHTLLILDGQGRFAQATISRLESSCTWLQVDTIENAERSQPQVAVALSWIKGERMDWAVEKLTEIGVSRIVPMHCERTVVRLDPARAAKRADRLRRIVAESTRQSERFFTPEVEVVADLAAVLNGYDTPCAGTLLWARSQRPLAHWVRPASNPLLLIGPEGGFTEQERDLAAAAGFEHASLGPGILRVETAAVVAATWVLGLAQK